VLGDELGAVEGYRAQVGEAETLRRNRGGTRRIAEALEALRPGDVVVVRRRGGRVAVLNHEHRRGGGTRLVAVTPSRDVVRLGPQDFDAPPRRAATIDLPTPFAPRNPAFRRQAAERLRRAKLRDDAGRSRREDRRLDELDARLAEHPLADDPHREQKLRAAAAIERLERDLQRTERRVRGRSESLARQFDRVLRVLEAWGYVDGWQLTEAGEQLARLYTETDLLLAEALREGLLDDLKAPELAAVVSCFTYERRGPDGQQPMPPARWPTKTVAKRARAVERIADDLRANEDDAGLPETRIPDPGFTPYAYEWTAGGSLAEVLDDDEMTGGDFVRHVKQCIDLLRQVGDVASEVETRTRAREAADACHRGVVAASSVDGA
jgi:ATP-dependent RNA helicase HelY